MLIPLNAISRCSPLILSRPDDQIRATIEEGDYYYCYYLRDGRRPCASLHHSRIILTRAVDSAKPGMEMEGLLLSPPCLSAVFLFEDGNIPSLLATDMSPSEE